MRHGVREFDLPIVAPDLPQPVIDRVPEHDPPSARPLPHQDQRIVRFGSFVIAAGALGEFGPIALISVVLTAQEPAQRMLSTGLLLAFEA
jgi:hypothetical protein